METGTFAELLIETLVKRLPEDETTVTIEPKELTDEAGIERHAEAVVAIAEVLEDRRRESRRPMTTD
ncbi:MAG: hypothetical protein U5K37_06245 [Natrialbaceae archaeon]|nr:hypothetical protein [Natrialbaceae archaeon]